MNEIASIFESMEYGPAPEAAQPATDWLEGHGRRFGHFVDGAWTKPGETFETAAPRDGEVLAEVTQGTDGDVAGAVKAARRAQKGWVALGPEGRARHLYALARGLQKHARRFAVLESLDNGKPFREASGIDLPLAVRHFYHHAGHARLMPEMVPGRTPLGVCGQVIPWNFPLLMLAWKVAPALAMGNTIVLKPAEWTPLTALAFCDLALEAGLPKGVLNVVTGDGATGAALVAAEVDKVAFTGSTEVGRRIREATAGTGKRLTLELGGKSPYIVFDDADLDSAVEGLVDAIWFNGGQVCCAGSRLLVQEGIAGAFHARLRDRMASLRVGDPLDKAMDVGAMIHPDHLAAVRAAVAAAPAHAEVHQGEAPEGCFFPPTLVTGLQPADRLMQEEVFGPVLVSSTFRTPAEAVAMANDSRYGLAASVWSENVNLALGVAPKLRTGIVWVNGTNMLDAAAPFGGVKESGFGREGGTEGLLAYTKDAAERPKLARVAPATGGGGPADPLDRTHKMLIGGRQARPDGGQSRPVFGRGGGHLGTVSLANRKDVRNAVEAAGAAKGWSATSGHLRAQILWYLAENLAAQAGRFADRIDAMAGKGGAQEVEDAVSALTAAASWADKFDGAAKGVPIRGLALALREPVGTIGILAPDDAPLLGLVAPIAAALAMGNRVVAVASQAMPLAGTDLIQVIETSDVPAGALNLLTGDHAELAPHLAGHMDLGACWGFSPGLDAVVEREAARDLKRTVVTNGRGRDWTGSMRWLLEAATEVKTVWVPYGEG
ncbi:aldehyde dehydrogenase (NAD+) [Hasllibacter halocynthiae]|uniref:Aldehyde dehydrogenase (NAD+) n=1 Tax=Hasllibacter halocynthiae TaxID=595589 RepID=A0A2T0X189_9RHOB|nr:aldehyde dehydrogenase family protein [Hasllibacter halocynthiae]PRY92712.1 aldehyde dehydrogenase (NAD+) [Hasllibacter halocynthiae]